MRLLAAFERQIEFSYTESAIKKQFTVSQTVQIGAWLWRVCVCVGYGGVDGKENSESKRNRGK